MSFLLSVAVFCGGAQGAYDERSVAALSSDERLRFVLSALEERDEQMRNFSFEVTESTFDLQAGQSKLVTQVQFTLLRDGARNALNAVRKKPDGTISNEFRLGWDGKVQRNISFLRDGRPPSASIEQGQSEILRNLAVNHLLGYRIKGARKVVGGALIHLDRTLPEWLDELSKEPMVHLSAATSRSGDKPLINLSIKKRGQTEVFALDPMRNYMPLRYEWIYYGSGSEDHVLLREVHEATVQRQVDGLWMPFEIHIRIWKTNQSEAAQEVVCVVSAAQLNRVTSVDLAIEFPAGAEVVDTIQHVAYAVKADGATAMLPLYNPATGTVTVGGKDASATATTRPALAPFALPPVSSATPQATARVTGIADAPQRVSVTVVVTALLGVLMATVCTVVLVRRHRRSSA